MIVKEKQGLHAVIKCKSKLSEQTVRFECYNTFIADEKLCHEELITYTCRSFCWGHLFNFFVKGWCECVCACVCGVGGGLVAEIFAGGSYFWKFMVWMYNFHHSPCGMWNLRNYRGKNSNYTVHTWSVVLTYVLVNVLRHPQSWNIV